MGYSIKMATKAVEEKINKICKNKKNSNIIQEYLTKLEEGDENDILEAIPILTGVFTYYTEQGIWRLVEADGKQQNVNDGGSNVVTADAAVNTWLHNSYKAFIAISLNLFSSDSSAVQVEALETLMTLLRTVYTALIKTNTCSDIKQKYNFPNQFFVKIVKNLVTCEKHSPELIQSLESLLKYDDIRYYFFKNIHSLIQNQNIFKGKAGNKVENAYVILIHSTKHNKPDEETQNLYLGNLLENDEVDASEVAKSYQYAFSSAWLSLMRSSMPNVIHKKILIDLDSKIMPKLTDPKYLIDFLTDSYDVGGVIGLLALNGLFILISQYNLDYPEFYTKLYNMLDPGIFHVKYKSRFFHLLDMFLSSTHLPAYLVASFVKKLARIALFTPATDQEMLLVFIRNLLIRHPSSRILIHRKNDKEVARSFNTDPFDYNETDPSKSNAMKSCLWELNTLKSHYSSVVLKSVALFKKQFPNLEQDVADYFDCEFEEVFHSKMNENSDNLPPVNFCREKEIFAGLDTDMWQLE